MMMNIPRIYRFDSNTQTQHAHTHTQTKTDKETSVVRFFTFLRLEDIFFHAILIKNGKDESSHCGFYQQRKT